MANQAIVLAKTIRANLDKAEQYSDKRDQMLIAAGKNLIQLKANNSHGTYLKLLKTYVTIKPRRGQQLMSIANSPDPAAALRKDRKETAERVAKIRAQKKSAVHTAHSEMMLPNIALETMAETPEHAKVQGEPPSYRRAPDWMEALFGLAVFEGTDCQRYASYVPEFDGKDFEKAYEEAYKEAIVKVKEAAKSHNDKALKGAFDQFRWKHLDIACNLGIARLNWIENARAIKWKAEQAKRKARVTKAERRKRTAMEKASEAEWETISAARKALMAKQRAERQAERKAERENAKAKAA